jgi:hypothetical protein
MASHASSTSPNEAGPGAYCEDAVAVTADGVRWLSRPGTRLVIN